MKALIDITVQMHWRQVGLLTEHLCQCVYFVNKNPTLGRVVGWKVKTGKLVYLQKMRPHESFHVPTVTYRMTLKVIFQTNYSLISIGMLDRIYFLSLFDLQLKKSGEGKNRSQILLPLSLYPFPHTYTQLTDDIIIKLKRTIVISF